MIPNRPLFAAGVFETMQTLSMLFLNGMNKADFGNRDCVVGAGCS